jgi:hypothetical protein
MFQSVQRQSRISQIQEEQARIERGMGLDNTGGGIGVTAAEANRLQEQAAKRQLELKQQLTQLEREERQFKMQNLETLRESNREMEKAAKTAADSLRAQQRSEMSGFGFMDAFSQQRALGIGRRLNEGGDLNDDDLQFARGVGPLQEMVNALGRRRAEATGIFQQLEEFGRAPQIRALEQAAATAREERLKIENDIKVAITVEPDKIAEAMTEKISPILQQMLRNINDQVAQAFSREEARRRNENQQRQGASPANS